MEPLVSINNSYNERVMTINCGRTFPFNYLVSLSKESLMNYLVATCCTVPGQQVLTAKKGNCHFLR